MTDQAGTDQAGSRRGAKARQAALACGVLAISLALVGCGASSGIVPVGPDTYAVTEMRAAAIGGGPRAQAAILAEAGGFCEQQGRSVAVLDMQPGGDPRGAYWPTAFSATFRCIGRSAAEGSHSPGRAARAGS